MAILNPSLIVSFVILSVLLLSLLYYLIRKYNIVTGLIFFANMDPVVPYFIEKLSGFILFGIVPFIVFVKSSGFLPAETILSAGSSIHFWYMLPIFMVIVSVLTFRSSRKKALQAKFPQLRIKIWSVRQIFISASGWIIYILGYEFLFRGILWFACYRAFGFWTSLLINLILYAIVHIDQGAAISIGTIPAGIVFCLITLLTGSFLFAFFIHAYMAVNTELFSIYHNPEIGVRYKLKRSGS